jgi:hypothetical protein
MVKLPSARGLHPDELSRVLCRRPATRVVPLAASDAGKTTLFAVLFEFLTAKRLPGWSYARSITTLGFIQRSHDASMRSNRYVPTTPHTSGSVGDELLHLEARRHSDGETYTTLLADVSGEHVDLLASTGKREPFLLDALSVADHVPILINGEHAADRHERQNAIRQAIDLINIVAELPLPEAAKVSIVLTKTDCFTDDGADQVVEHVLEAAASRLGAIPRSFRTAARPRSGTGVSPGTGILEFFECIVEQPSEPESSQLAPITLPGSPGVLRRAWRARP